MLNENNSTLQIHEEAVTLAAIKTTPRETT